jgi:anti-sigma factor RsiW
VSDQHLPFEDLTAYALDSLEPAERADVERHAVACPTCARRVEEYRAVVGALPFGLEPVTPPPAAWDAIQEGARRQPPRRKRATLARSIQRLTVPVLAAAGLALLTWNVLLQRELARYTHGPQVDALARRPGRLVILTGAGAPGASARLLVAADGGHGHLAIAGLKPLPRERTYQVWFVRPGAPALSGGTFAVDAEGGAWASVEPPPSLDDIRTIMVTEEPAPGSPTPTGQPLVLAERWR